MKTNHSKLSSLLFNTDDTKKCLWHFSSPSFMRDYKDICSAGYAVVLFCEYAFQNAKIPGIPSGQKMIFRGWPESHFLFTAPTRCSIVLSSQQAKKQFIVSTIRKPRLWRYCQNTKKGISTRQGQYLFPLIISHLSSIKATNWNWTKSLRDGLPRLWLQRFFYLKTKRQLKLPWKVFIV